MIKRWQIVVCKEVSPHSVVYLQFLLVEIYSSGVVEI
jgi:hypothetical protein